ncbi:uncharacterized protein LOC106175533 isoform X2 [Lingula anatina]|uniref:Uncharacterized protein LOC106175533 isoform X2 n=1 Tax=Lingula anatina TaxID=7574 RepID=A0A1S3JRN8_LINAN|nr:uncharacterized protein LOC106175533 isoform X2 [Lingula anatina]|eukprot:XP_013413050.1 uncharacterized protein LOC106175533 isoform X2 [Lingula anatina]
MTGINVSLCLIACLFGVLMLEIEGSTYYTADSYDCGESHYVYTYSSTTLKAWQLLSDRNYPPSSCTMYFDTGIEGDVVRVSFINVRLPCFSSAKLHFYDGYGTYVNKLKTLSCTSVTPQDFRSSGRYLTVKLESSSSESNYDFEIDLWEEDGGSALSIGIILGIVGGVFFIFALLFTAMGLLCRRYATNRSGRGITVMRPVVANVPQYPPSGQINPGFGPPPAYSEVTSPAPSGGQANPGLQPPPGGSQVQQGDTTRPYPQQQFYAPYPQQQSVPYPQQPNDPPNLEQPKNPLLPQQ